MKSFLILTAINATLLSGIAANAAVVKDHTCTHRDGTQYECSVGVFNRNAHMKQCGTEWKAAKADKAVADAGWPAYWHLCSQRLKAAQQ